jgi:PIN domain nuclease of toxin-antitoxin system
MCTDLFVIIPQTVQYNNYLDSIYIVLGIASHLEMSAKTQEGVLRLCANITPWYTRCLSRSESAMRREVLKIIPIDTEGRVWICMCMCV